MIAFLCAAAATAGFFDAIAGGGGLIQLPALMVGLQDKPVRFFVDDAVKFVQREIRRGSKYNAIILDPPSFGRGSSGELWEIEKNLSELVSYLPSILVEEPLFILINLQILHVYNLEMNQRKLTLHLHLIPTYL